LTFVSQDTCSTKGSQFLACGFRETPGEDFFLSHRPMKSCDEMFLTDDCQSSPMSSPATVLSVIVQSLHLLKTGVIMKCQCPTPAMRAHVSQKNHGCGPAGVPLPQHRTWEQAKGKRGLCHHLSWSTVPSLPSVWNIC
jgi:hypothetical protein